MPKFLCKSIWRAGLVSLLLAVGCGDRNDPAHQNQALEAPTPPPPALNAAMTETSSDTTTESSTSESLENPN